MLSFPTLLREAVGPNAVAIRQTSRPNVFMRKRARVGGPFSAYPNIKVEIAMG